MSNYRSVSEVCYLLNDMLQNFNGIVFQGEISEFTHYRGSGHWYFTLKDERAQIRCVMYSRDNLRAPFVPAVGNHVVVKGRFSVYEKNGALQCTVQYIKAMGSGQLYEQFLQMRAKLEKEGLFDKEHKKSIRKVPATLGIITGLQTAALRDVLQRLTERAPYTDVIIYPTAVQGITAHAEIIQAIECANRRNECDTLLLVRGGGSLEDLWTFNEEQLARAIYASRIPIITGVGHESDITIADLVADLRTPTPTAAAEMAATAVCELELALRHQRRLLEECWDRAMDQRYFSVDRVSFPFSSPEALLEGFAQNLYRQELVLSQGMERRYMRSFEKFRNEISKFRHYSQAVDQSSLKGFIQKMTYCLQLRLDRAQSGLNNQSALLESLSPQTVLHRGYSLVRKEDKMIGSFSELVVGDRVEILFSEGKVSARIEGKA